ncbi:MAG: DUF6782 family putative metallopeptidase [Alphaproteobacteria bacterium]|jgi:hypothetical protein
MDARDRPAGAVLKEAVFPLEEYVSVRPLAKAAARKTPPDDGRLERLLNTVSQYSPTGRALIEEARKKGAKFSLSDELPSGTLGCCNASSGEILLNAAQPDAFLLTTLVHEARHSVQELPFSADYSVGTALKLNRAREADAVAWQAVAAYELKDAVPEAAAAFEKQHFRTAWNCNRWMDQGDRDKALCSSFRAWYADVSYVNGYDASLLKRTKAGLFFFSGMSRDLKDTEIVEKICPYAGGEDLSSSHMATLSEETAQEGAKIQKIADRMHFRFNRASSMTGYYVYSEKSGFRTPQEYWQTKPSLRKAFKKKAEAAYDEKRVNVLVGFVEKYSPTGKKLIEEARRNGVEFVMSHELPEHTGGICYPRARKIALNASMPEEILVSTLVHEARHAAQGLSVMTGYTTSAALKLNRALEADAKAHEAAAVTEMQKVLPQAFLSFKKRHPRILSEYQHEMEEGSGNSDKALSRAFNAWYTDETYCARYDASLLKALKGCIFKTGHLVLDIDNAEITKKVCPYMTVEEFSKPSNMAVCETTARKAAKIQKYSDWFNSRKKKQMNEQFPVIKKEAPAPEKKPGATGWFRKISGRTGR